MFFSRARNSLCSFPYGFKGCCSQTDFRFKTADIKHPVHKVWHFLLTYDFENISLSTNSTRTDWARCNRRSPVLFPLSPLRYDTVLLAVVQHHWHLPSACSVCEGVYEGVSSLQCVCKLPNVRQRSGKSRTGGWQRMRGKTLGWILKGKPGEETKVWFRFSLQPLIGLQLSGG